MRGSVWKDKEIRVFFRKKEKKIAEKPSFKKSLFDFFVMIVLILCIHACLYQPFTIPSGSMIPTLLIGDFIFVRKFAYAYSRYSLFLQPKFIRGRIELSKPNYGDIAVFFHPYSQVEQAEFYDHGIWNGVFSKTFRKLREKLGIPQEGVNYIKRVVGLPGDKIQMINGYLHINGKKLDLEAKGDYLLHENGRFKTSHRYEQTLPNGKKHIILKTAPFGEAHLDNTKEWTIPPDHYFMMGDNRDNSADSREFQQVGFVPASTLVGKPDLIFFSTTAKWYQPHRWLFGCRYKRLLTHPQ